MTTSLQKDALLSQFSVLAYKDRDFLNTAGNLPSGWVLKADSVSPPFAAFAFKNLTTGEVVVAYRGTDGIKDGSADLAILAGKWDSQFQKGLDFIATVQSDRSIVPLGTDPRSLLVAGHSLGGAIAQIVATAYGLDGSTIDPGAAARIVQQPEFQTAAIAAGLPPEGLGAANTLTNYLVAGSLVSGASGTHLGQVSYLPTVTFSGLQASLSFLIGAVNPVAGIAYAFAIDQVGNKHSSLQVSQALGLLAGVPGDTATPASVVLHLKEVGTQYDPATGLTKPSYSQTEFDIKDSAGVLLSTAKFLGSGPDRTLELRDAGGVLQSTTTVAATGVVTVRPINAPSITVTPLPGLPGSPDDTITTETRDPQSNVVSSTIRQADEAGNMPVIATITDTPDASGNITRVIDTTSDSKPIQITQQATAAALANGEQPGDYSTTAVQINGAPAVNNNLIAASIDSNYPSAKDIILNRGTGEFTDIAAAGDPSNPDGTSASLALLTGRSDWWNDARIGTLASDAVGLISALRGGKPLPIATAGLNFASHQLSDPAVADIAAALSAVGSLKGLVDALEKGDLGRILIDGGGVARSAITIYSNSLGQEIIGQYGSVAAARFAIDDGDTVAGEIIGKLDGASALLETLGTALAVLNIINSLANGDIKGAVIAAAVLYFESTGPLVGAILTAVDFLYGLFFPNEHQFEANGRYVGGANGEISVQVDNVNGGAFVTFVDTMTALLEQTRKQAIEIGKLYGQPMGVIAERLPTIEFKQDVMFMRFNDPLTGQSFVRTFDMKGTYLTPGYVELVLANDQKNILASPWGANPQNTFVNRNADPKDINPGNQIATSKLFFDNITEQYSDAVTKSGAIAPLWEVQTVNLQRLSGDEYAGQTTEAIAYENGTGYSLFYGAPGDARPGNPGFRNEASQQSVTIIALDLNGDGVITTTKKQTGNGVLFDVDNDGFAEETDWIGPRDGILVLDRTTSGEAADGQIDRGADLFNDAWVDGTRRKLSVLNEINDDNSYYGSGLNAQDPVFAHLKVWTDINGDGVAQKAELQTLAQLGITNLAWNTASPSSIGSITQNGQTRLMQSVDLNANAAGVATRRVGCCWALQRRRRCGTTPRTGHERTL